MDTTTSGNTTIQPKRSYRLGIVLFLLLVAIVFSFGKPFTVDTDAFKPELTQGTNLVVIRVNKSVDEGDYVVFQQQKVRRLGKVLTRSGKTINVQTNTGIETMNRHTIIGQAVKVTFTQ